MHRALRAFGNPLEWTDVQKTVFVFAPPIPFSLFYLYRVDRLLANPGAEPYISRPALELTRSYLIGILGVFVALWAVWLVLRRREGQANLFVHAVVHSCFVFMGFGAYLVGPFSTPILIAYVAGGMVAFLLFDVRRATQGSLVGLGVIVGTALLERAGFLQYGPVFANTLFGGERPPDVWIYLNLAFTVVLTAVVLGGTGLAMTLARARQAEVNELLATDILTGLANRRRLEETLEREVTRALRFEAPLSVVMLDLDHFKRVNDEHGHRAGDAVLSAVGQVVASQLREVDAAGRYGGEELLLVLPEATLDGARAAAERVRAAIGACEVEHDGERLRVTVSAGCATLSPTEPRSADQLVRAADAALYTAKKRGRDRVDVETDTEASGAELRHR